MNSNKNSAGLFAALWALLFGVFHLLWSIGIYVGLPEEQAKEAFDRNWFYLYNLIAALLCFFAFGIGILLYRGEPRWKRVLVVFGWCVAVILILRGMVAVLYWLYCIFSSKISYSSLTFWDLWFLMGGLLFLIGVRRYEKRTDNRDLS